MAQNPNDPLVSPRVKLPTTDTGMNKLPPKLPADDDTPDDAKAEAKAKERETKARKKKEGEIVRRAVKRYRIAAEAEADNRAKAVEDLKFKAGDQWPADVAADRNAAKRPCLTINKIPTLTHQVENDIRQNRPAINVSPLGDIATKESSEIAASFIRAIERDSAADIAYDTGVTSAIDIGFGYWRILTERQKPDSFNQVIVLKRVRNPFTVLLDPQRQEPDGCDSKYGFVSELVERDDYRQQWPDAAEVAWKESGVGESMKLWMTKDQIRIAEYFEIEHEMRRLVQLDTGVTAWYDELSLAVKAEISAGVRKIVNDELSEIQRVMWYKLTALEILESRSWLGKWIPIVECLGDEIDVEGKVVRMGIIRPAKDSQRMKNYWATSKTEMIALAPKAPWLVAEGQDEGYETEYLVAHQKPIPVLHYVPVTTDSGQPVPPPMRQQPGAVPAGMVEAEKSAEQDMMATTGIRFDATKQERTYDESGKAIKELRRSSDIGAFHYSDNMARSLRHTGRILLDLIPKIYDTRRTVQGVGEDGKDQTIRIDPTQAKPVMRANLGPNVAPLVSFNPRMGEYGVTVTIGPSYATKRIEAQENMTGFLAKVPDPMRGVVAALIAKYSDWPGSTELFSALAKLLPPGALAPDPKDVPPQLAALIKGLQNQVQGMKAEQMQMLRDLTDKKADQALVGEKIKKDFEAKLMKVVADFEVKMRDQIADQFKNMMSTVQGMEQKFNQSLAGGDSRQQAPEGGGAQVAARTSSPGG